jgi:hypothetical protein
MEKVPALPDDVLELGRRLIPHPAFLAGCARSGTSILGEALAAHPRVRYLFELSPMWRRLVPDGEDHRLERGAATAAIARAAYEALAAEAGGRWDGVLLEKNPKHVIRIPFLDALFPWARFIHILRDGRDTAASLMFRNRGAEWGHLKVPGWRGLLERYREANHIRCAHQWREAVSLARRDARELEPGRYLEVRYEDLVREPARTIGLVLGFLELPPDPAVEAFLPRIQDVTAGSYHARKQVRHYIDNHERRIGRHRENLTPLERAEVEAACGELLRQLGYAE